jgi:acetylornithine/N-succinyldiaminopimelate aminotransferase
MDTYARLPVEFVRGAGTRLWDDQGNEYLDFLCGISVSLLGHCHPAVVEAVCDQSRTLIHVGNLFHTEPPRRLAERLAELSIGGKVFLANSGAEAIECALKLARKRRQGGDFVVLQRGFHGRTYGALSATPQEAKQAPFAPLVPGFTAVPPGDPDALLAAVTDRTAAVLIEAVQGEGGIHPLESGLLEAAREACDEHGALLICDEIQCGLGRTGELWGFQHAGIEPDVMTLAKGLGGGPLVTGSANAILDALPEHLPGVRGKGDRLRGGLERLGLEVRGIGLMLAFRTADGPELVQRALQEQRLVLNATGPDAVRLLPPLNVSDADLDEAVSRISAVL